MRTATYALGGIVLGFVMFAGITNWRLVVLLLVVGIPFALVTLARLTVKALKTAVDHFVWGWFRTDHDDRALRRWQREAVREAQAQRRERMRETRTFESF